MASFLVVLRRAHYHAALGGRRNHVSRVIVPLDRSIHLIYGNIISRRWNSFSNENEQDGCIEDLSALKLSLIIKTDVLSYSGRRVCDVSFNAISYTLRAIFAHQMFQSIECIEKRNEKTFGFYLKGLFYIFISS